MGKPKHERSLADNEAKAITRNLRVSPQKLNLVAQMIRGKKVDKALAELEFSRKRISDEIEFLRRDPQVPRDRLGLVVGKAALVFGLAHVTSPSPISCRRCGHGRSGSARTRRTCGRPCPR